MSIILVTWIAVSLLQEHLRGWIGFLWSEWDNESVRHGAIVYIIEELKVQALGAILFGAIFSLVGIPLLRMLQARLMAGAYSFLTNETTAVATSHGLTISRDDSRSIYPWSSLARVVRLKKATCFFLPKKSCFLIPDHGFSRSQDAEAFAAFAKAQLASAPTLPEGGPSEKSADDEGEEAYIYSLRYRPTFSDYMEFSFRAGFTKLRSVRSLIGPVAIALLYTLLIEGEGGRERTLSQALWDGVWIFGACLGGFVVLFAAIYFLPAGLAYRKIPAFTADNWLRANSQGVRVSVGGVDHRMLWRGFTAVEMSEHVIYLFQHRLCAVIIPRRAFASPEEADAFAAFAEERIAATKA